MGNRGGREYRYFSQLRPIIRVHEILVQHPSNNISIVRLQRSRFKIVHLFRGKDKVFKAQGVQHL